MIMIDDEVKSSLNYLKKGEVILYPTDTVWGIGCDATDEIAIEKIFKIKNRIESKSLIVLVNSFEMLQDYIPNIPKEALEILFKTDKPTTIIYNKPIGLAQNCVAKDNTVAIRLTQDKFCQQLIHQFGKPIISTSANISGQPTPSSFKEINKSILESVDYVVNLHRERKCDKPSSIYRIERNGTVSVIRK